MSYQRYENINFSESSRAVIEQIDAIVREFDAQGFRMTLRQIYYQFVARDLFPDDRRWRLVLETGKWVRDANGTKNAEPNYDWLGGLVTNGRLAGMIDWDAIEDRAREFIAPQRWESGSHILRTVAKQYHEDLWVGQATRAFVVVEKEALVGVLEALCSELDVPLLAAKGYPSGTVLREFVHRDVLPALRADQSACIVHVGDHDPSGVDMTRDLEERVRQFTAGGEGDEADEVDWGRVSVSRVALNMDQVRRLRPPPSPAKVTDSRAAAYIKEYGRDSWELDALSPVQLAAVVRAGIKGCIDDAEQWAARLAAVAKVKKGLERVASQWEKE